MTKRGFILILLLLVGLNIYSQKRQMRAAWIATVANIDWPTKGCVSVQEQQQQMIAMLDSLQALNINTIYFQARPMADALYDSQYEPWSEYLTGKQGVEPQPYYDPLAFVIHEGHKRMMQVHVWINPYRALNSLETTRLDTNHLFFYDKNMFVRYGTQYIFNPALEQTREYLNNIVTDIVTRYDIDGIHMDDYFYPYRIAKEEFPDNQLFILNSRGFKNKDEWRRDNVNLAIEQLSKTIKQTKPWVEFGISPFGVWRNKSIDSRGSDTKAGQTNYDDLYADILLWLEKGWIDYVVPQLYWEIGKKVADYQVLVKWWSDNSYGKNLYIGLSSSNLNYLSAPAWKTPNELCRQMNMNEHYEQISGVAFFSAHTLLENRQGLCDSLKTNYFRTIALPPTNKNLNGAAGAEPTDAKIIKLGTRDYLSWEEVDGSGGQSVDYYIVYCFDSNNSDFNFDDPTNILTLTKENVIDLSQYQIFDNSTFVVSAVNRFHYESLFSNYVIYNKE